MKTRIQCYLNAILTAVVLFILLVSAYVTEMENTDSTFTSVDPEYLGLQIKSESYTDKQLLPGDTVNYNMETAITGEDDAYVFVEFDIPAEFTMNGFQSESWHPVGNGRNLYYYGTDTNCVSLGKTNGSSAPVFSSLTLSTDAALGENFATHITAYAIQAANINADATPATIFSMVGY